jgi:pyruvate formate lyase activating enzyme
MSGINGLKQAKHYKTATDGTIICELCPHYCRILSDESGLCRSRKNTAGKLFTLNYAHTVSLNLDPIEKKPLYHFFPGSQILSIGPNSCNLSCDFCQNYSISQNEVATKQLHPAELLDLCKKNYIAMVAYTYTEPITWFEFVLESSELLKTNNIQTVMVTNGFINPEPLSQLLPYIDAMNIDLKSMNDDFYKDICGGSLKPVLETIKTVSKYCHLEITNLLITDENDSDVEIQELTDFIASVNPEIPLHLSRYHPDYKRGNPATPSAVLERAYNTALKKLSYVYLGNIASGKSTYCPECAAPVIKRAYKSASHLDKNKCSECDRIIYGRF